MDSRTTSARKVTVDAHVMPTATLQRIIDARSFSSLAVRGVWADEDL
jgi:hypothetical protein